MVLSARGALLTVLTLVLANVGGAPTLAEAEGCPNEQRRVEDVYSLSLPDCRAYEQVSPTDKNLTDALGEPGFVQAAPSGEGVTFFSILPFSGVPGASGFITYLSARGGDEWVTYGLLPPTDPGARAVVFGLSEDLSVTVIGAQEPVLAEGATPGLTHNQYNYYVHDNVTGSYRLLAPGPGEAQFADSTPDGSRILFEDEAKLSSDAVAGVPNLYEWDNGQLRLVGVLPNEKAPAAGSLAGAKESESYSQETISEDGSRVFFTDLGTGRIYVREPQVKTTIPVSEGSAVWRAATPDGAETFYTEGEGLYRFDVGNETREELTSGTAGVLGTLGVSDEGSYVYFVATGVLASENSEKHSPVEGAPNLYDWHDGATTFVAGLHGGDEADWRDFPVGSEPLGPAQGQKSSRVTPAGTTVLFSSRAQLTGYDNSEHTEFYRFEAASGKLTCVSCNPRGVRPTTDAYLTLGESVDAPASRSDFLTRNLSADGRRVFFQTEEALVPKDTNGQMDVYEWEREGAGSCPSGQSAGCMYLLSTGQSSSGSYFGDASASGDSVFLFTRQSLVGQDQDDNIDVYDARADGGIAEQNLPPAPVPCIGNACRGTSGSPPVFGAPSTVTVSGVGNLTSPTTESQSPVKAKPKSLTGSQQLANALRACEKKPRKKRARCKATARKRYSPPSKAKKSARAKQRRHS